MTRKPNIDPLSEELRQVGELINNRREALGFEQADLARKLKVSIATISKYERGRTDIPISRLFQLADALDVPASAFLPDNHRTYFG